MTTSSLTTETYHSTSSSAYPPNKTPVQGSGNYGAIPLGSSHTLQQAIVNEESQTTGKCSGCNCQKVATVVVSVVFGLALFVGVIGLLVYLGQLNLGLANVGNMTIPTGLYTMLAGGGVALLLFVIGSIKACHNYRQSKKENIDPAQNLYNNTGAGGNIEA